MEPAGQGQGQAQGQGQGCSAPEGQQDAGRPRPREGAQTSHQTPSPRKKPKSVSALPPPHPGGLWLPRPRSCLCRLEPAHPPAQVAERRGRLCCPRPENMPCPGPSRLSPPWQRRGARLRRESQQAGFPASSGLNRIPDLQERGQPPA